MYLIKYTKLAILKNNDIGNISQGDSVAYMDCSIEQIENKLKIYLSEKARVKKYYPIINEIIKVDGHIVI